jgi:hypothetical protein
MLTSEQRQRLENEAARRGIDAAALIREAEAATAGAAPGKPEPGAEKPNLFMYLLPFVTVNEVRTIWLELDPVAGGDKYAAQWAAEQVGPTIAIDPAE